MFTYTIIIHGDSDLCRISVYIEVISFYFECKVLVYAQLYSPFIMAEGYRYMPQTKVEWTFSHAYAQFRLWRKEVERIINGPMHGCNEVHLNYVKCIIVYTHITLALYRLD